MLQLNECCWKRSWSNVYIQCIFNLRVLFNLHTLGTKMLKRKMEGKWKEKTNEQTSSILWFNTYATPHIMCMIHMAVVLLKPNVDVYTRITVMAMMINNNFYDSLLKWNRQWVSVSIEITFRYLQKLINSGTQYIFLHFVW